MNAKIKIAALTAAAATSLGVTAITAVPTAFATGGAVATASDCASASQSTVKKGSQGASVTYAQCLLNEHGASLAVDGVFGAKTDAAVRSFQGDKGLDVDGIVGPKTWAALTEGNDDGGGDDGGDTTTKRQAVLDRAQSWIDEGGVPYSQTAYHNGYRTDCSGYASMALGLDKPGLNTVGLAESSVSDPIKMTDLQPGDLVIDADGDNTTRHVVIFVKWTDSSKSSYIAYDQSGSDNTSKQTRTYGLGDDDYDAYRPHVLK